MKDPKKQKQQNLRRQNVIEQLKDLGTQGADDFFKQLLGTANYQEKRSGDITPGESVSMSEMLSGRAEENRKLRNQIALERNMAAEESRQSQEKINALRVQLQALITEITKLSTSTSELAQETVVATMQLPAQPGIYHINFFEKMLSFVQSFRKKIDQAAVWLSGTNKRAEKKNYWAMYKKKGSSFLLSPDHYLQRSAG